MEYNIKQTGIFSRWLLKLKDIKGKVSILRRIERVRKGNFGDYKGLGDEISELRISVGAGYRIYYTVQNNEVVLLLVGGDKSSQKQDIQKAKKLAKELKDGK
jgi:putative addiction module killer protein